MEHIIRNTSDLNLDKEYDETQAECHASATGLFAGETGSSDKGTVLEVKKASLDTGQHHGILTGLSISKFLKSVPELLLCHDTIPELALKPPLNSICRSGYKRTKAIQSISCVLNGCVYKLEGLFCRCPSNDSRNYKGSVSLSETPHEFRQVAVVSSLRRAGQPELQDLACTPRA